MRFSLPHVIFTVLIETEDAQVPHCRLSFATKTFRQCTIECVKIPKIASFAHNISLSLPESATKVVISDL